MVDVLDCVHASGGADGWRSLFNTALDQDDVSSVCSDNASLSRPVVMAVPPNNIPAQVEVGGGGAAFDEMSVGESLTAAHMPITPRSSRKLPSLGDLIAYKVVDGEGHTYVIRAQRTIESITKRWKERSPRSIHLQPFSNTSMKMVTKFLSRVTNVLTKL